VLLRVTRPLLVGFLNTSAASGDAKHGQELPEGMRVIFIPVPKEVESKAVPGTRVRLVIEYRDKRKPAVVLENIRVCSASHTPEGYISAAMAVEDALTVVLALDEVNVRVIPLPKQSPKQIPRSRSSTDFAPPRSPSIPKAS
jgi:hypothetical protein